MIGTGSFFTDEIFSEPLAAAYALIAAFLFGSALGSFFNCMAWRIVHGESVLHGRSHCPVCGHTLGFVDLIPIAGWLIRKGKCHYCGTKISPRYLAAELVCGTGWLLCLLKWGLSWETARGIIFFCLLLALSLVDLESMIIPDRFLIAAIINWAVFLPLVHETVPAQLKTGLIGALALGGGMLVMTLIFDKVTGKESMGGGDIKLFFVCGLYLGAAKGLMCVILSCVIGLVMAAIQHKGTGNPFPFGPSIALACFICMLVGDPFISWYLSLL